MPLVLAGYARHEPSLEELTGCAVRDYSRTPIGLPSEQTNVGDTTLTDVHRLEQ